MPIGFHTYTGRATAMCCYGESPPPLTASEKQILEFSDAIFECCDAGRGIVGNLTATYGGSSGEVRFAYLPSGCFGLESAIGVIAPNVQLVIEVPACTDDGASSSSPAANEKRYADDLVGALDTFSRTDASSTQREIFASLWNILLNMRSETNVEQTSAMDGFAKSVVDRAWPHVRQHTTSLSIRIDRDNGIAHCLHGFGPNTSMNINEFS